MTQPAIAQPPITLDSISSMLGHIPAHDRNVWIRCGMAIKSELGDCGFDVWNQWSQSADNYNPKAVQDVWQSIKDGPVSIGTLIHMARMNGWHSVHPSWSGGREGVYLETPYQRPAISARDTSAYGKQLWRAAVRGDKAVASHPYANKKEIGWAAGAGRAKASGSRIGKNADCIIVPIRTNGIGEVQGVQCINANGDKQTFGKIKRGCLVLGNTLNKSIPWFVAEGWASAVSTVFHHCKGNAVCGVAFGKSNRQATAQLMAEAFQPEEIQIHWEVD